MGLRKNLRVRKLDINKKSTIGHRFETRDSMTDIHIPSSHGLKGASQQRVMRSGLYILLLYHHGTSLEVRDKRCPH